MRKSRNTAHKRLNQILAFGALISAITLLLIRFAGAQSLAPGWSYTGSLNTAVSHGNATRLFNGKVLVVGSTGAELYDPATGTWSLTGSLSGTRWGFTMTLLPNGKVLVAGGRLDSTQTVRAELYDPATGTWSLTGNLTAPRDSPTATLLPSGKVLVMGGFEGKTEWDPLNTAELYNPATGKWSSTGKLHEARVSHAATLLQDGKVLVTGGCRDGECFSPLGNAEVYDPDTETWKLTGSPNFVRDLTRLTTLPNGSVLLLKSGEPEPWNRPELYNPVNGHWSYTAPVKRRGGETVTLLPNGQVLVAGGSNAEVFSSAELYDPVMGKWNATAYLNTARAGHTATVLTNGKALVVGGGNKDQSPLRTAELYSTTGAGTVTTVSSASYYSLGSASEAIASAFGTALATATSNVKDLPLPIQLAGTTVKVKDSTGIERLAPLFYVSPEQVNYQIPSGTALGAATVTITNGNGTISTGEVLIRTVVPGLFAANANGQGVAAAVIQRVRADGSQSYEPVAQFDVTQNKFIARPIDLGPATDQVYLVMFGTGIRQRRSLSAVITSIGGTYAEVSYAGLQPEFVGVDQINVLLPRELAGRGEVEVLLTVETQMANPVRIQVK